MRFVALIIPAVLRVMLPRAARQPEARSAPRTLPDPTVIYQGCHQDVEPNDPEDSPTAFAVEHPLHLDDPHQAAAT